MIVRELLTAAPTAAELLGLTDSELERILLEQVSAAGDDSLRRMLTCEGVITDLYYSGQYSTDKQDAVRRKVNRAWRALEQAELIEEPDPLNGKAGYRVITPKGRTVTPR